MESILLAVIAGLSILLNGFLAYLIQRPSDPMKSGQNMKMPPPKEKENKLPMGRIMISKPPDSEWTKEKVNVGTPRST